MKKTGRLLLSGVLLLVVGYLSLDAAWHFQAVQAYNGLAELGTPGVDRPPRHSIFLDTDPFLWNRFALQVATGQSWRIRHTDFDNAPYGREVHWSSGFVWLLAGSGWLWKLCGGGDIQSALEKASLLVNPVLFVLLIAAVAVITSRRLHWLGATALTLALGGSPILTQAFLAAKPDHHGPITAAALSAVLCLFIAGGGFVRKEGTFPAPDDGAFRFLEERRARAWFIASAVCAGIGLWLSAISLALVIAGIGLGVLLSLSFSGRSGGDPDLRYAPGLWRWWGAVIAAVSVFFYLLEYFPRQMGWRLEVNHPLYALACWGGAYLLAWFGAWRTGGETPGKHPWALRIAAAAALLALPLLVWRGGSRFYQLLEPFLWRWHQEIFEFTPVKVGLLARTSGLLLAFGLVTIILIGLRGTRREHRALALLVVGCVLLPLAATFWQRRWETMLATALVVVPLALLVLLRGRGPDGSGRTWPWWLIILPLLAQFGYNGYQQLRGAQELKSIGTPHILLASYAAAREAGEFLRVAEPGRRLVILSPSWPSTVVSYAGDHRGIGSLYWENIDGLRAALDLLTTQNDEEALRLIRERGITHIVLIASDYNPSNSFYRKFGFVNREAVARTFETRLTKGPRPWWVTPMDFRSSEPMFLNNPLFFKVIIFRIYPF